MSAVINSDKDTAKRDRSQLEQALAHAGARDVHRKAIRCPFHDDKHPSASISRSEAGYWYFRCFVCDIAEDVWGIKALVSGMPVADVLKEDLTPTTPRPPRPRSRVQSFNSIEELLQAYRTRNPNNKIEEVNPYTDPATGDSEFYTLRIKQPDDRKTFLQVSKKENGWQYAGLSGKLPLFNRVRIEQCDRVLIVEGEKCVRAVTQIGVSNLAATTSPGGSVNALKADWTPLAGKKCYIWRDNDDPGKKYEEDVISELLKLDPPANVYRVHVDGLDLEPKGDVADYLNEESMTNAEKVAALELVLYDAEGMNVTSALEDKFARIASGEFRAVAFPQKTQLSENTKAILPGCLTTIVGEPGAGKSFLVLEDFWRWSLMGEKVKLLMLEDDAAFHQNRVLAQMSGYADLLDPDFVLANQDFANEVFRSNRDRLEQFARHLEVTDGQMTLDDIAEWVTKHAESGIRIIGVDPITAAKASDKPWIDDQRFLFTVKPILERTGASLILTTHPRIGQAGKPSLSGIAGGASYPRFSQCVLWLRNLEDTEEGWAWNGYRDLKVTYKQVMQIRKARNGKGQGKHVALQLNFQNLCFDELGTLSKAKE